MAKSLEEIFGTTSSTQKSASSSQSSLEDIFSGTSGSSAAVAPAPEKEEKGFFRKAAEFVAGGEIGFGESIAGGALPTTQAFQGAEASQEGLNQQLDRLRQQIRQNREQGKDSSALHRGAQTVLGGEQMGTEGLLPDKSTGQVIGEAAQTAADVASFGTFGKAPLAFKTLKEAVKFGIKKEMRENAILGGTFGLSEALQNDEDIGGVALQTIFGVGTGGFLGGITGGVGARTSFLRPERAAELQRKALAQYKRGLRISKDKLADDAERIIPTLLAENISGTRRQLLRKALAGKQLAREEYEMLGELTGYSNTEGLFTQLEDEMQKLRIGRNGEVVSVDQKRYQALKDLKQDLTSIRIMENGTPRSYQEDLRRLADRYGQEIYASRKSQQTIKDNARLSEVRKLDAAIRNLLSTDRPDYGAVNEIFSTSETLRTLILEAEKAEGRITGPFVRLLRSLAPAAVGATAGAPGGAGVAVAGAVALGSLGYITQTTWWNTMRAVRKNRLAEKLLELGTNQRASWIKAIERQGLKAVNNLIGEDQFTNITGILLGGRTPETPETQAP